MAMFTQQMMLGTNKPYPLPHGTANLYSGPYYVPAGVTRMDILVIGGGGAGADAAGGTGGRGGGGGGSARNATYPVTPGERWDVYLGAGGNAYSKDGGVTTIVRNGAIIFQTTASQSGTGGVGAIAGANMGGVPVLRKAGDGAAGSGTTGGAGGGAAGATGPGSGQTGNAPGGNGGAPDHWGYLYGGGGGGGSYVNGVNQPGGNGGFGLVRVTY